MACGWRAWLVVWLWLGSGLAARRGCTLRDRPGHKQTRRTKPPLVRSKLARGKFQAERYQPMLINATIEYYCQSDVRREQRPDTPIDNFDSGRAKSRKKGGLLPNHALSKFLCLLCRAQSICSCSFELSGMYRENTKRGHNCPCRQ